MFMDFNNFGGWGGGEPQSRYIAIYFRGLVLPELKKFMDGKITHTQFVSGQILKTEHTDLFDPMSTDIPIECAYVRVFEADTLEPELVGAFGYGMPISSELAFETARKKLGTNTSVNELDILLPRQFDHYMTANGDLFRREDDMSYIFTPPPLKREILWSQYDREPNVTHQPPRRKI